MDFKLERFLGAAICFILRPSYGFHVLIYVYIITIYIYIVDGTVI